MVSHRARSRRHGLVSVMQAGAGPTRPGSASGTEGDSWRERKAAVAPSREVEPCQGLRRHGRNRRLRRYRWRAGAAREGPVLLARTAIIASRTGRACSGGTGAVHVSRTCVRRSPGARAGPRAGHRAAARADRPTRSGASRPDSGVRGVPSVLTRGRTGAHPSALCFNMSGGDSGESARRGSDGWSRRSLRCGCAPGPLKWAVACMPDYE